MMVGRTAAPADPSRMNLNQARGEPARMVRPGPLVFRGSGWACLGACLLTVTAGCQAPPGRPAACGPEALDLPRKAVLARQLLADTAVAVAHHPARAGY